MAYTLSDFNYNLPPGLIAQTPLKKRAESRLLVLNKTSGEISHRHFFDLPGYLKAGDLLVINNTKVFPARLIGATEAGGKREIFLHHKLGLKRWECLVKGKARAGLIINFKNKLRAILVSDNNDGTWQVEFNFGGTKFSKIIETIGQVPLPPYIKRVEPSACDKKAYQTIYAVENKLASVAAPTAGLHFTSALLKEIKARGVEIVELTLQVGLGTFSPVKSERLEDHKMHRESVEIKKAEINKIIRAKRAGRRVIAVGTTSARTLEAWGQSFDFRKNKAKQVKSDFKAATQIFIYPPYKFQAVDALITNFHLPKSTLLMLISALAGKDKIERAYAVALAKKYRFFSYGDAMLIL